MHRTWAFQTEDLDKSENESREFDYVNIIHRTVRTYLECGGWDHVLGRAHEGTLHAEMLWLRVCARLFPPSFVDLPRDIGKGMIPKRMNRDLMPEKPSTFMTWIHTLQTPDKMHLPVAGPATSLRNYAALSMLDHASIVEKDLGLSSYTVLEPVLTDNFVYHHRYLGSQYDCVCVCFHHRPEPRHPLHLALAHGLDGFVGEFLNRFSETTTRDSPDWDDVFYLDVGEAPQYQGNCTGHKTFPNRITLLEFALRHTTSSLKMQIVTTLLEKYSRVEDAEMVYALANSTPEIVQLLLTHWPERDMVFDMDSMRHDGRFENEINFEDVADKYRQRFHTRPLWHIARRIRSNQYQDEELLDIFLKRGEDINGQCGPVGTALHANLLRLPACSLELCELLIGKGADVNAHGPLGKPLELVWRLAHKYWRKPKRGRKFTQAIEWLIDYGAINEQQDPNGSVPSKEQMLAFNYGSQEEFKELLRYYRGEERDGFCRLTTN